MDGLLATATNTTTPATSPAIVDARPCTTNSSKPFITTSRATTAHTDATITRRTLHSSEVS